MLKKTGVVVALACCLSVTGLACGDAPGRLLLPVMNPEGIAASVSAAVEQGGFRVTLTVVNKSDVSMTLMVERYCPLETVVWRNGRPVWDSSDTDLACPDVLRQVRLEPGEAEVFGHLVRQPQLVASTPLTIETTLSVIDGPDIRAIAEDLVLR